MKRKTYISLLFLVFAVSINAQNWPRFFWNQIIASDTVGAIAIATPGLDGAWSDSLRFWQGKLRIGLDTAATLEDVRAGAVNFANTDLSLTGNRVHDVGIYNLEYQTTGGGSPIFIEGATGDLGLGTNAPEGTFHVYRGNSGVTFNSTFDRFIIEDDIAVNVAIATPNTSAGAFTFHDNDGRNRGTFQYDHPTDKINIWTTGRSTTPDLTIQNGIGNFYNQLRIGAVAGASTAPFHVTNGAASGAAFSYAFDRFVFDSNASANMALAVPNTASSTISFHDSDARNRGGIQYGHSSDRLSFWSNGNASTFDLSILNNKIGIAKNTPAYSLDINSTDAVRLPIGTTAQRPTGAAGVIRYSLTNSDFEGYSTEWRRFAWYNTTSLDVGNYSFNIDQTVGAGQDNYILTYDDASGEIGLEAATGGAGDDWGADVVNHDGTLTGNGTSGTPLKVDTSLIVTITALNDSITAAADGNGIISALPSGNVDIDAASNNLEIDTDGVIKLGDLTTNSTYMNINPSALTMIDSIVSSPFSMTKTHKRFEYRLTHVNDAETASWLFDNSGIAETYNETSTGKQMYRSLSQFGERIQHKVATAGNNLIRDFGGVSTGQTGGVVTVGASFFDQGRTKPFFEIDMGGTDSGIYVWDNLTLKSYGTGAKTGTEAYNLSVDANGKVITTTLFNGIYTGSGSLSGATTVTMASNTLTFDATAANDILVLDGSTGDVGILGLPIGGAALAVGGTESVIIPSGTTAQEPTPQTGMIRHDATKQAMTGYQDGDFRPMVQTLEMVSTTTGATIVVYKNAFLYCDITTTSQTITLDPTDLSDGSIVKIFVTNQNDFTLDSDTGSFFSTTGSFAATQACTAGVYEVVWDGTNWFFYKIS